LTTRRMDVKPWETASESPFGGSRWGGSDRRGFALSPDGKLLAGEDAGGWQLELWDVATGKSLGRFGRINDPVALAFSPDSKTLVTTGGDLHDLCPVDLWDVAKRKKVSNLDEDVNWIRFSAAAFSPDGKVLALAAGEGRRSKPAIHLWDTASGDELRQSHVPLSGTPARRGKFSNFCDALTFSPDGKSLALLCDDRILLWEVATLRERGQFAVLPADYTRRGDSFRAGSLLAFSPDGRVLAAGCWDGIIRLWDMGTGRELLPLMGYKGGIRALTFAGRTLLSFGWDGMLRAWPVAEAR
jgi:WD40 repeat protein